MESEITRILYLDLKVMMGGGEGGGGGETLRHGLFDLVFSRITFNL